ncbi:MAG: tyrosine-type recombinase/integrase [Christensenellaceae bacterium]|jgi:hypothetical protein|nr:tyrosine-type recombinase/integrase [Christensenellaceae bacterium]
MCEAKTGPLALPRAGQFLGANAPYLLKHSSPSMILSAARPAESPLAPIASFFCLTVTASFFALIPYAHTFATVMMELGVSPKVVQELLGHADIQTMLGTYTFASIAEMAKATHSSRDELDNLRQDGLPFAQT